MCIQMCMYNAWTVQLTSAVAATFSVLVNQRLLYKEVQVYTDVYIYIPLQIDTRLDECSYSLYTAFFLFSASSPSIHSS